MPGAAIRLTPVAVLSRLRPMSISIARERLVELLELARGKRIAVVGDAMLDVYLSGDVERISPETPVPVVRVRERRYALGGAANVAQNVAALGGIPRLVAAVGRDAAGARVHAMLGAIGAGTDRLVEVDRPTTTKTRILARVQQVVRVDEEEDADLPAADAERIARAVDDALNDADALVLEDYNKGVLTAPV